MAVGKPSFAPAFVSVHDFAAQLEARPQQPVGLGDLAGEHQAADVAGGDDLAVDLEQRVHDGRKARVGGQQPRVALCLVAKAEILADRDLRGTEGADEHVVDELARRALGELRVERDHDQLPHAQLGHELGLARERRQQFGRVLRGDDRHRMRVKREHAVRATDHLAMTEMHPIEGANRDAALSSALDVGQASDLHGRKAYLEITASACSSAISGGSRQVGTAAPFGVRAGGATASRTSNGPIAVRLSVRQYASPRSAISERT